MLGTTKRAWAESILAVVALTAAVVTAAFPTWFEALFEGSNPDSGSGALEWLVTAVLLAAFVVLSWTARRDFHKARAHPSDSG